MARKTSEQITIEHVVGLVVDASYHIRKATQELERVEAQLMARFNAMRDEGTWVEEKPGPHDLILIEEQKLMRSDLDTMRETIAAMARSYLNEVLPGDGDANPEAYQRMSHLVSIERWLRPFGVEVRDELVEELHP